MMTLDQRARHAADAVHAATGSYAPVATMRDVARRRMRVRALGAAVGGLAVFAALIAGAWFTGPQQRDDVAKPTVPTPTSSVPVDPTVPPTTVGAPYESETDLPGLEPPVSRVPDQSDDPGDGGAVAAPPTTLSGDGSPTTTAPAETKPPDGQPPLTTDVVDTTPPRLSITSPEDGAVIDERRVRFKGETEPGAKVTVGRYEATMADDGGWSLVLVLTEGRNRILFRSTDPAGNEATARITVYYEPAPTDTKPPPDAEFAAFATFGSCAEDPPYDVYYGIAEPGTKVQIISEYGSGQTVADAEGHWEVKVFFPSAPFGKTFLVTAKDQFGNSKRFEFTSLLAD